MRRLLLLPALALALVLTGCGLSGTNNGGWITGTGAVQYIASGHRGDPVSLTGTSLENTPVDLATSRGKVTVINVWGAWCGSCIDEATKLQQAHQQLGAQVPFVGIDIRDTDQAQAQAFERNFAIDYPSIYSSDGTAVLAFNNNLSPRTIPATIILDQQGRVAAIIRGSIETASTLVGAVQDVGDGKADAGGTFGSDA
jgi:thiol-disulfide isomerase/thioredoxin